MSSHTILLYFEQVFASSTRRSSSWRARYLPTNTHRRQNHYGIHSLDELAAGPYRLPCYPHALHKGLSSSQHIAPHQNADHQLTSITASLAATFVSPSSSPIEASDKTSSSTIEYGTGSSGKVAESTSTLIAYSTTALPLKRYQADPYAAVLHSVISSPMADELRKDPKTVAL